MSNDVCPCCGQDLPGNLVKVDLLTNTIIAGGVSVKVQPRLAEIAHLLWSSRARTLSAETIADSVYKANCDGTGAIRVYIRQLRETIELNGLPVDIRTERAVGYRWVDFSKSEEAK